MQEDETSKPLPATNKPIKTRKPADTAIVGSEEGKQKNENTTSEAKPGTTCIATNIFEWTYAFDLNMLLLFFYYDTDAQEELQNGGSNATESKTCSSLLFIFI